MLGSSLLVIAPAQSSRQDVHAPTSNIDLLPTILGLAGKSVPAGLEGRPLPGLGGSALGQTRSIFSVEAKECSAFGSLDNGATISLIKDSQKLIYYTGYRKRPDVFELYELQNDPEEMSDLMLTDPSAGKLLRQELLDTFEQHRNPK